MFLFKKTSYLFICLFLIVFFSSCEKKSKKKECSHEEITAESKKANDFFDKSFNDEVSRDPERESFLGIKKDFDKWTDRSDEFLQKELEFKKNNLEWLKKNIDFEKLDAQTQLSLCIQLFKIYILFEPFKVVLFKFQFFLQKLVAAVCPFVKVFFNAQKRFSFGVS